MNTHIKVFSTKLFGCQRRGCPSDGVSIRRPLDLFRYLKNILSAILFRGYKVAVVESSELFVNSLKTPEKLELISSNDEVKLLLNTKIEQVRGDHPSLRILFFKDKEGGIYSGYCSEEDKSYHITDLVQEDNKGVTQEENEKITPEENKGVVQEKNKSVVQEKNGSSVNQPMGNSVDEYKEGAASLKKMIGPIDETIGILEDEWYKKVNNTITFISKRKSMGYYSARNFNKEGGASEGNKKLGSNEQRRDIELEKAMLNAENITDMCIESIKKEYVSIMASCGYSSSNDNRDLASFWSMKGNEEYKKMQKDRLFNFVKCYIADEMRKQDLSNDDAKQKLGDLRSLAAVFWPTASMEEPLSLDEFMQNDEFNEMAEHLFIFRFEKEKKLSYGSIGNENIFQDRKVDIADMRRIKESVEFTCTEYPSMYKSIPMMNMQINKMTELENDVRDLVGSTKEKWWCLYHVETSLIDIIYESAERCSLYLDGAYSEFMYTCCEDMLLTLDGVEKELGLILPTVDDITKVVLEGAIQKLSDELDAKFKMGSLLSRKLACRQIAELREAEVSTKNANVIAEDLTSFGSCKMANEIAMNVFAALAKKSEFWKAYTTTILMLRGKVAEGSEMDGDAAYLLERLEIIYEDCLFKVSFLLEAYSDVDNKKVVFDCIDDDKIIYFKQGKKKNWLVNIIFPAILGEGDSVVFKGLGNNLKFKRLKKNK